jgi:hypothetical protein
MAHKIENGLGITDIISDKREAVLRLAAQYGAYNVRVFGSVARGEARPDSDVDFLMDFREGTSLWEVVALWQALGELLGCKVSVIAEEAPTTPFMQNALKDAVPL